MYVPFVLLEISCWPLVAWLRGTANDWKFRQTNMWTASDLGLST